MPPQREINLSPISSLEGQPIQRMTEHDYLKPGEIVPVDISLTPTGMRFRPGEQLRLHVAGFNMRGAFFPELSSPPNHNRGAHIIHAGGRLMLLLLPQSAPCV